MDHHLVARFDPGHHGEDEAVIGTGVDDNVPVRVKLKAVFLLDTGGDELLQLRVADGHSVVGGEPVLQLFDCGVQYGLGD